jgi:hypothetical protein
MRKFKEGYYCTFDIFSNGMEMVCAGYATHHIILQHIADSNFTKNQAGYEILDIRFYSPDHKKVTMEEATEIIKVKKEGWINVYPCETKLFPASATGIYHTREQAVACAYESRIDCIKIEWFE